MRHKLANEALKHLSLKIGSLWVEQSGLGTPFAKTPDVATADDATRLIGAYMDARAAYDEGDYLAAIGTATEDEA